MIHTFQCYSRVSKKLLEVESNVTNNILHIFVLDLYIKMLGWGSLAYEYDGI